MIYSNERDTNKTTLNYVFNSPRVHAAATIHRLRSTGTPLFVFLVFIFFTAKRTTRTKHTREYYSKSHSRFCNLSAHHQVQIYTARPVFWSLRLCVNRVPKCAARHAQQASSAIYAAAACAAVGDDEAALRCNAMLTRCRGTLANHTTASHL